VSLPPALDEIIQRRLSFADDAVSAIEGQLLELLRRVEPAVRAYLESGDARGLIISSDLDAILGILDDIEGEHGPILDSAQRAWVDRLQDLSDRAIEDARKLGLSVEPADVEAVQAVIDGQFANAASAWDVRIRLPLGDRLLARLTAGLLLEDPAMAGRGSADDLRGIVTTAVTEARTETAAFDRLVAAETAKRADPTDSALRWVYVGPDDPLERPFCRTVHDYSWTREQVSRLNNGQRGASAAIIHGGGYNCRHQWAQLPAKMADGRGLRRATDDDVERINAEFAR
jgi:hypothetical protein